MTSAYIPNNQIETPQLSGPRLARVVSHGDSEFMGTLYVQLLGMNNDTFGQETSTIPAHYCPPFFGATNEAFNGSNTGNSQAFNDTQKSYGMSFVPPDIGVTVLVIFVQDIGKCFWIGCVPNVHMNHMVPAIAASASVDGAPGELTEYGTSTLPVAEINVLSEEAKTNKNTDNIKRPVHPLAGFMLAQGLVADYIRGPTTSTMRRNYISNVYGISTPGPLDKRPGAKKAKAGTIENPTEKDVFVSRVGGTQLVMDDGDDRFVRTNPAGVGKSEYVSSAGAGGDLRIPFNEYFRVRTRTGHQLLMHNSEDLIYIGNSKGTAWIELSSNGKIDIYSSDSISIHSEGDFNFRADRDVNIEAGRNINFRAEKSMYTQVVENHTLIVGKDQKIQIKGTSDTTITGNSTLSVDANNSIKVKGISTFTSTGNLNFNTAASSFLTSGVDSNILSGNNHKVTTGNKIYMNSSVVADPATPATAATAPTELALRENINVDVTLDWKSTGFQSETPIKSIMKRIPMHEPWPGHENVDPEKTGLLNTDRDV